MKVQNLLSLVRSELLIPLALVTLRLGGAFAAFSTSLIMARTMDPSDMGVVLTCLSVAPLAAILVTGSTDAGCVRFIIAYLERGEFDKARGMVRFNRRVTLSIGTLLFVALSIWLWFANGSEHESSIVIAMTALTGLLLGWLRLGAAHAMALGKVVRSLAPFSFFRQVLLFLSLGFWLLLQKPLDVHIAVTFMLVSTAVVVALQAKLNHIPMMRIGEGVADFSDQREWVKVGLQLGLTLIFVQFSRDLTIVISSWSLSSDEIAVLGITTAIVGFAKFYVIAVNQSITPKISAAIARQDTSALMQRVAISNHMKFWPMLLAALLFWLLGDYVAAIFGPNFSNITPVLLVLSLEPLALAFFGPGGNVLSLSGHQFVMLPLSIATVLFLIVAITMGAHLDGVRGAAIGSSFTWIFWSASLALLTHRYTRHNVTLPGSTVWFLTKRSDN